MLQAHSATTVPGRSSASEPRIADQTFAGHSSVFQGAVARIERGWNIYREGDFGELRVQSPSGGRLHL